MSSAGVAMQLRYLERYGSSGSLRGTGSNGGGRNGGAVIRVDGAGVVQVRTLHQMEGESRR